MESKIIEPDQELGFWDKPIKQPAAEDFCAQHLQHFGKLPHALDATVPASTEIQMNLNMQVIVSLIVKGQHACAT